jgi:hypothetical protein
VREREREKTETPNLGEEMSEFIVVSPEAEDAPHTIEVVRRSTGEVVFTGNDMAEAFELAKKLNEEK